MLGKGADCVDTECAVRLACRLLCAALACFALLLAHTCDWGRSTRLPEELLATGAAADSPVAVLPRCLCFKPVDLDVMCRPTTEARSRAQPLLHRPYACGSGSGADLGGAPLHRINLEVTARDV